MIRNWQGRRRARRVSSVPSSCWSCQHRSPEKAFMGHQWSDRRQTTKNQKVHKATTYKPYPSTWPLKLVKKWNSKNWKPTISRIGLNHLSKLEGRSAWKDPRKDRGAWFLVPDAVIFAPRFEFKPDKHIPHATWHTILVLADNMLGHRTPGAREKMLLNIFDEWYFPGIERKYKPSENIRRGDEKVVYVWHSLEAKERG